MHFDFSDDADVQWLRDRGAWPALVVDALVAEDTRPHVVKIDAPESMVAR